MDLPGRSAEQIMQGIDGRPILKFRPLQPEAEPPSQIRDAATLAPAAQSANEAALSTHPADEINNYPEAAVSGKAQRLIKMCAGPLVYAPIPKETRESGGARSAPLYPRLQLERLLASKQYGERDGVTEEEMAEALRQFVPAFQSYLDMLTAHYYRLVGTQKRLRMLTRSRVNLAAELIARSANVIVQISALRGHLDTQMQGIQKDCERKNMGFEHAKKSIIKAAKDRVDAVQNVRELSLEVERLEVEVGRIRA